MEFKRANTVEIILAALLVIIIAILAVVLVSIPPSAHVWQVWR